MPDFFSAYKAYIFDLDGTLADSAVDVIACMKHAIRVHNLPDVEVSPFHIGPPLADIYRTLLPELAETMIQPLVTTYREAYNDLVTQETRLFPGIVDVLTFLQNRCALIFVATNKASASTRKLLDRLHVLPFFTGLMSADSYLESRGRLLSKAEMIEAIMAEHALEPHDAVMIGDSVCDIEGGKKAGVATMAVLYGYGRPEVMQATGADFFVREATWAEYLGGI